MEQMRTHPVVGERLLSMIEDVPIPVVIASAHQERFDGTGSGGTNSSTPFTLASVTAAALK